MKFEMIKRIVPLMVALCVIFSVFSPAVSVSATEVETTATEASEVAELEFPSSDAMTWGDVIFPKEPELVGNLSFGIPETEIVGSFSYGSGKLDYYFYAFTDLPQYAPEFAEMVEYHKAGFYLGLHSEPWPAVTVCGKDGNTAVFWCFENQGIFFPVMAIGDAGVYSFQQSVVYDGEEITTTFEVELPADGICVVDGYVGWSGYVYVFRDLAETRNIVSATGDALAACIGWVGGVVTALLDGKMSGILPCVALGVGVSVFFVVVSWARRRSK